MITARIWGPLSAWGPPAGGPGLSKHRTRWCHRRHDVVSRTKITTTIMIYSATNVRPEGAVLTGLAPLSSRPVSRSCPRAGSRRHTVRVQVDLAGQQWGAVTSGSLVGPDTRRYQRRSTRMPRRQVEDLLAAGAPLVLYWYGGGQLEWFEGQHAAQTWQTVRPRLTTSVPRPDGDVVWSAGRWVSDDESIVVLTGTC